MRNRLSLSLTLILFLIPGLWAQEEKPVFRLVVSSFDNLIKKVGQVADQFQPGISEALEPMLQQQMPPGLYDNLLKDQPMALYFFKPQDNNYKDAVVLALPLKPEANPTKMFGGNTAFMALGSHFVIGSPNGFTQVTPSHLKFDNLLGDISFQVNFGQGWNELLDTAGQFLPELNNELPGLGDFLTGLLQFVKTTTNQLHGVQIGLFLDSNEVVMQADAKVKEGTWIASFVQKTMQQPAMANIIPPESSQIALSLNLPKEDMEQFFKEVASFVNGFLPNEELKTLVSSYLSLIAPFYSKTQMGVSFDSQTGLNFSYICQGLTLADYMKMMEKVEQFDWNAIFKPLGIEMGMNFSQEFVQNVRTTNTGDAVHHYTFKMSFEGDMAALQNQMIEKFYGKNGTTFEVVEVNGYLVMASISQKAMVDELAAKLRAGLVPAEKNKMLSAEIDLIGYYASIFEMMGDEMPPPIQDIVKKLHEVKSKERVSFEVIPTEAGFSKRLRIPLAPIVEVTNIFKEMMMDKGSIPEPIEIDEAVEHETHEHKVSADSPESWVGKIAPNFTGKTTDGADFKLDDYRGKVIILDFWATWCPPCIREIPGFVSIQDKYRDKNVVVIGVSDEDLNTVKTFMEKNKMNYVSVYGCNPTMSPYGLITGIPTTFIIDTNQVVQAVHVGFTSQESFEKEILPYLGGKTPSSEPKKK